MKDFDQAQDFIDKVTNTDRDERHQEQMAIQNGNRAQRREAERQKRKLSKRASKVKSCAA